MAALKLITPSEGSSCRISQNSGITCCHHPPCLQAEMAALKLITSSRSSDCRIQMATLSCHLQWLVVDVCAVT
eukprot:10458205-Karenia_brevis.AAC.1